MERERLEKYGNELTIIGFVVGNSKEQEIIVFPEDAPISNPPVLVPDRDTLVEIFNQLDTLEITGIEKAILRKSQRNIEQGMTWDVFRRDDFTCRYCGADSVPMTVDHIVLWEDLGLTDPDNLICACRKCNKTRGNMKYPDWLNSEYYKNRSANLTLAQKQANIDAWPVASALPLRPRKRGR